MAIFTFSTKDAKPEDAEVVKNLKQYCDRNHLNFSGLVVQQLKKLEQELIKNGRL